MSGKKSPTQRTLEKLRSEGYTVAVVERWNPHARIRQDLYGCIDVLAVGNGKTIAVQATSGSNVAARVTKLTEAEALSDMRSAGWTILVHGWRKSKNGQWVLREVDCS